VERFFQVSLLGLVTSGYLAVAGSGYLDTPTVVLTAAGLVLRALLVFGILRLEISERVTTLAALGYSGFFALDYFLLSRDFLAATVHLLFFLAVMKILTARTSRDYLYTAVIAFLELLAAAILSININFFVFLALYLLFAMAALSSGEIRRSMHKARTTARSGLKRFHPRLGLLSALVTLGILVLTAGLFFLLPRTADAAFSHLVSHGIYLPGFSNQVTLGEFGEIKTSSRPVMHIRIYSPELIGGLKWRGGALTNFDGKHWSNLRPVTERIPIDGGHVELRPADMRQLGRGFNYDVALDAIDTDALFFAGIPQRLDLRYPSVVHTDVGSYRLEHKPVPGLRYGAYSLLEQPPESTRLPAPGSPLTPAERERYLERPALDPRIAALARDMTVGSITDLERARTIERRLRSDYGYTLQLPDHEVTDPLAYFLFSRRKGHCEYFASAMAIMLRTLNIPTRMATGFQSGMYNPLTELWVIRASDAHTWVEAWIPRYGWTTFDPTPPDTGSHALAFMTRLSLYVDAAETFWQEWVVSYDPGHQGTLMDKLEQNAHLLGLRWFDSVSGVESYWSMRITAWLKKFGIRIVIVLALGVWIWMMGPPLIRLLRIRRRVERVRRGQASVADATLLYQRMLHILKRRGYQKPAWFTPAEFAASLPPTAMGAAVTEFTLTYNAMRFGGHTEVASRLSVLLDSLERQERP
jgi:hypothetical protein